MIEHTSSYMYADRPEAETKRMYYSCDYYYDTCYNSTYNVTTYNDSGSWFWLAFLIVCGPIYAIVRCCAKAQKKDKSSSSSDEDDKFKKAKNGVTPSAHATQQPGFNTYGQ